MITTQTSINEYGNFNLTVLVDGKPCKGYNNIQSIERLFGIIANIKSKML